MDYYEKCKYILRLMDKQTDRYGRDELTFHGYQIRMRSLSQILNRMIETGTK